MNKDSIRKLVNEAIAIEQEEARKAGAISYMARALIQATLPHSRAAGHEFKRKNGAFRLTILADSEIGLPYGSIPRLLMSWITTEAVRTHQRELILGQTLSEFMASLDIIPSGGRWGTIVRLKDQMKRLFAASISCTYDDGNNWRVRNVSPIEEANLWWDPKNPHQATIWESTLLLGSSFFEEIIESPVPIDMRALKALRQSPMAIDIYCWLTYRMSYLRRITHIPWLVLQMQFGADYKDVRQFRRRFLSQLRKVLCVYSDVKVKEDPNNLTLFPSKPHIQNELSKNRHIEEPHRVVGQKEQYEQRSESELQALYTQYCLDKIVEVIEELPDQQEKHRLLKSFDEHLERTQQNTVRGLVVKGKRDWAVKKALYEFVNNHWNHVLKMIESYGEFCQSISK